METRTIRAGDTVRHKEYPDEKWLVASVSGDYLYAAGWPETCVKIETCDLVESCTDEQHVKLLLDVAKKQDSSRSVAAFYNLLALMPEGILLTLGLLKNRQGVTYQAYLKAMSDVSEYEARIRAGEFLK